MWMKQVEACAALNLSPRTLARRIKAGEVDSKREGRHVLVDVVDAHDPIADVTTVGSQLAEVATANAIQRRMDADVMDAIRQTCQSSTTHARWSAAVAILAAVAMGVVAGRIAMELHTDTIAHAVEVRSLAEQSARHLGHADVLTTTVGELRSALADSKSQNLALESDLAGARGELHTVLAERDGLTTEITLVREQLEDFVRASSVKSDRFTLFTEYKNPLIPSGKPG